jgi:cell division protein FtsB
MLEFELYIALYLLFGVGYFYYHRKTINEAAEKANAERSSVLLLAFMFVLAWPLIALVDLIYEIYYSIQHTKAVNKVVREIKAETKKLEEHWKESP